jgi:hypothetical protein
MVITLPAIYNISINAGIAVSTLDFLGFFFVLKLIDNKKIMQ